MTTLIALVLQTFATAPATASPAPATSAYATYNGPSMRNAKIPAQTVQINAFHSNPLASVTFSVADRVVGQSTSPTRSGTLYRATASVDLAGLSGPQTMRIRYFLATGRVSTIDVPFAAVVPAAPVLPATPAPTPPPPVITPVTTSGPGASDTGVTAPERLRQQTGNVVVTTPGSTVADLDLTGCLVIQASDVIVRNVRVSCAAPPSSAAIQVLSGYGGLLVEDSEIDGLGTAAVGVGYSGFTLRRVEVRNVNDGVRMASNTTLEASWIHDMARLGDLHPDAVQSTGGTNIAIRGNTLAPQRLGGDLANSAIQLGSETATTLSNLAITSNHLSGGNFTINMRGDTTFSGVSIASNVFSSPSRYGPIQAPATLTLGPGNVHAESGFAVTVVAAS